MRTETTEEGTLITVRDSVVVVDGTEYGVVELIVNIINRIEKLEAFVDGSTESIETDCTDTADTLENDLDFDSPARDAVARLTAWVRDYGEIKPKIFVSDLTTVLQALKKQR